MRRINEAMDTLNARRVSAGEGVTDASGPMGQAFNVNRQPPRDFTFYGVLVNAGPDGTADFSTSQYWVYSVKFGVANNATPLDPIKVYMEPMVTARWGVASHIAEVISGTHTLPVIASTTSTTTAISTAATLVKCRQSECGAWVFEVVAGKEIFSAKISDTPTAINGGIRWTYPIKLGHWDMTSSPSTGGTWVDDSGGTAHTAFNEAEDMNTFTSGTGAIGTGNTNVDQATGTINGGSCNLIPLNAGDYVSVKVRGADSSGNVYYSIINKSNSAQ